MEDELRTRISIAATVLAVVATACTSQTISQLSSTTLTTVQQETSTASSGPTQATTAEGFLLPPGYDPDDFTTTPREITVFDDRTTCDPSAEDLDVLRMQSLVAAYNARDAESVLEVMRADEIYDATAVPHLGSASTDDPLEWAQTGWDVNDQLRLVMVRSYSGGGADGRIERSNDLLEQAGIGWLSYTFKVQASGCAITRFVGYRPLADQCEWYTAFSDQLRTAEILVPEQCGSHVLQLGGGDVQASFEFEAPDPLTHYFDVEVTMPIGTELDVTFLTADGVTLRILDSDKATASCADEDGQLHCLLHYPILEARQAGIWTGQIHKLSTTPAEVTIKVTWMQLDEDDEVDP
jgi:hypothetical protein